jgi:hypothetical protein
MTYIVIPVEDPGEDPYFTLLDASGGRDLRAEHKYASKTEAEQVADKLNGIYFDEDPEQPPLKP